MVERDVNGEDGREVVRLVRAAGKSVSRRARRRHIPCAIRRGNWHAGGSASVSASRRRHRPRRALLAMDGGGSRGLTALGNGREDEALRQRINDVRGASGTLMGAGSVTGVYKGRRRLACTTRPRATSPCLSLGLRRYAGGVVGSAVGPARWRCGGGRGRRGLRVSRPRCPGGGGHA